MTLKLFCKTLFLCLFLLSGFVSLARAEGLSIAVVDMQSLLTTSNAAKGIHEKVKAERAKFLDKLGKQEESLRAMEKDIVDQAETLSVEEKAVKKKEFEQKFAEARKLAKKGKADLEAALITAMTELEKKAFEVIGDIAKEKGYQLVVSRQYVVVAEDALDISEEAMKKLNEAVSDIELSVKGE